MTNQEMAPVFTFFQRVSLTKIADRQLRNRIASFHMALLKEIKAVNGKRDDIGKEVFKGKEKRMDKYSMKMMALQNARSVEDRDSLRKEIDSDFAEEKALDEKFAERVKALMNTESKVKFEPFDMTELVEALTSVGTEITGRDLATLEPIFG